MGAPPLDPRDRVTITAAPGGYHVTISAVHPPSGVHRVLDPTFWPTLAAARAQAKIIHDCTRYPVYEDLQAGAAND